MKFFKLGVVALLLGSSFACRYHVMKQSIELSRDITYISFSQTKKAYVFKGEVGGEQTSITNLIGFAGERYEIKVTPKSEKIKLYVSGEGAEVKDGSDPLHKTARVNSPHSVIEIALTAHPGSEAYVNNIRKIIGQQLIDNITCLGRN